MKYTLIAVGKVREKAYRAMADEYLKRLSRYARVEEIQIPDEQEPASLSPALEEQIKDKEGAGILRHVKPEDYVIALDIEGQQPSSVEFAHQLQKMTMQSIPSVVFIIGGSLGLSSSVLQRTDQRMSMGRMTFPHQLARVMMLEQLYRAMKINAGERYHK